MEYSIVNKVSYKPMDYSNGMRTNCYHKLVSFPSYCLFNDGIRRLYCTSCPTIILKSMDGYRQDEYCIEYLVYAKMKQLINTER
jgi:hypothetical protein